MKILLYSLIFAPDVCSNAYVFSDLALELQKQGHEITVITTTPHYDEVNAIAKRKELERGKKSWYLKSTYSGIRVAHIVVDPYKGKAIHRLKTYFTFMRYGRKVAKLEGYEADIVLSQTPPFFIGIGANHVAKQLKAKSVLIYQDLFVDGLIKKGKLRWPASSICKVIERKQLKSVDAVTTISKDMYDVLSLKNIGKKITIIPNFVNTSLYHPNYIGDREKYGLDGDDFVISYVGNMGNAQDLMPLLVMAEHLTDVKVLIAGNGVNEKKYRDYVEAKELKNVIFLGFVSREETCQINALSNICMIMLARHVVATSFPSKTYTLMAMGKPIVVTCGKRSSVGEFITENGIGISCDVDDIEGFISIVNKLKNNEYLLTGYGERALRKVNEEYSEQVVAKEYVDLFRMLVKNDAGK